MCGVLNVYDTIWRTYVTFVDSSFSYPEISGVLTTIMNLYINILNTAVLFAENSSRWRCRSRRIVLQPALSSVPAQSRFPQNSPGLSRDLWGSQQTFQPSWVSPQQCSWHRSSTWWEMHLTVFIFRFFISFGLYFSFYSILFSCCLSSAVCLCLSLSNHLFIYFLL